MQKALSPEDRFAIKDLLSRYNWALDTGDVEAFVGCFAPDGVMIEEVFENPDVWAGRDGIRRLAEHYRGIVNFPGRQHYADNILVTPTGEDHAQVRSFALVTECHGEPPYQLRFCGYYDDEIVRLEGLWFFAKRVVRLWDGEVLERFPSHGAFVPRKRPAEIRLVKKP
nr:nuclear transport factor 2 family protein [uncultured Albidiferax sp.]